MATIRKYRGKFNVQIRKKGYPFTSKSFVSFTVAKKWAITTEADMERHVHVAIPDHTTVGELLERYRKEILPTHKGQQVEGYRIQTLFGVFGGFEIDSTDPSGNRSIQRSQTEGTLPGFSQAGTCDLEPGVDPSIERLGYCPAPEPRKDDYLA